MKPFTLSYQTASQIHFSWWSSCKVYVSRLFPTKSSHYTN